MLVRANVGVYLCSYCPAAFLGSRPPLILSSRSCRICHCEGDEGPLITPCHCTGSLRFVHQSCLQQWIKSSDTRCCELCKYEFIMETKLKPLRKVRAAYVCVEPVLAVVVAPFPAAPRLLRATAGPELLNLQNVPAQKCLALNHPLQAADSGGLLIKISSFLH